MSVIGDNLFLPICWWWFRSMPSGWSWPACLLAKKPPVRSIQRFFSDVFSFRSNRSIWNLANRFTESCRCHATDPRNQIAEGSHIPWRNRNLFHDNTFSGHYIDRSICCDQIFPLGVKAVQTGGPSRKRMQTLIAASFFFAIPNPTLYHQCIVSC